MEIAFSFAALFPRLSIAAASDMCDRHRQRHGRDAAEGAAVEADTVFSGTILELFPSHATSVGGHPGVVRVRSVYKGDLAIERFPVVVEGFGSSKFCWIPSRKVKFSLILLTLSRGKNEQQPFLELLRHNLNFVITLSSSPFCRLMCDCDSDDAWPRGRRKASATELEGLHGRALFPN